ncbi:MAG: glycoside hydrolase family 9 protein [Oscillospiraceae bacterium]|nr:glycoside hydrolase family 9 protein [Oscillospiraceae bacterium]
MNKKYFERDHSHIKTTPFGIFVNQAGYTESSTKRAVLPFECDEFEVVDLSGNCRYAGKTEYFGQDEASGDIVYTADFSGFREAGEYRINSGGKSSAVFRIGADVYDKVFHDTAKAFYYLRCGCGLEEKYVGVYHHGVCHGSPAILWSDHSTSVDVSGGWHDAGDYGRYVTAGVCAAAHLLYAFKMFPAAFEDLELNIPKENMPDILSEVKYELEWLLKMQRSDGGVYHKATTALHAPFVMPEEDTAQMYVFDVSSMATADLAAVTALASGMYREYDMNFSDRLFEAAKRSLEWLDRNPEFIGFHNPEGNNTGSYGERDDDSNRYWAYAEMYALTGDKQYHDKMMSLMGKGFPLTGLGYTEMGGFGSLAYLLSSHEKDDRTEGMLKKAFKDTAAKLKEVSDKCGYGVAMEARDYHWGSNMTVMKNGMIFAINDRLNGDSSGKEYAARQLDYLLGVNALGISYVTGHGEFRCNYPHLRPAFADGIEECIPGMVAGGPNGRPADPFAEEVIKAGTPPMKCYVDDTASYSLNEITIYWNSPAVFVLGYLCDEG